MNEALYLLSFELFFPILIIITLITYILTLYVVAPGKKWKYPFASAVLATAIASGISGFIFFIILGLTVFNLSIKKTVLMSMLFLVFLIITILGRHLWFRQHERDMIKRASQRKNIKK